MNYCDSGNYWLLINSTDPLNQLNWLANVLQNSENIGEKVIVLKISILNFFKNFLLLSDSYNWTSTSFIVH
jgi:hypothetical protein